MGFCRRAVLPYLDVPCVAKVPQIIFRLDVEWAQVIVQDAAATYSGAPGVLRTFGVAWGAQLLRHVATLATASRCRRPGPRPI